MTSLLMYSNNSGELEAAKVVKQMLAGLTYIHRLGYIHCDIKPGVSSFSIHILSII